MRPSSRENSRLLRLGKSDKNSISASRTWGDFAVYNLYNYENNRSSDIRLDFSDAGLPSDTACVVYDFWQNKVIGKATNSFTAKNIPCIGDSPQLVGSNLHLSIGATEIDEIFITSNSIKLIFSNGGAQTGDLLFHSRNALSAGKSENCSISSVQGMGDNLWKVSIKGRIWNSSQSIRLNIN